MELVKREELHRSIAARRLRAARRQITDSAGAEANAFPNLREGHPDVLEGCDAVLPSVHAATLRYPVIYGQRFPVGSVGYKAAMPIGKRLKERRKELGLTVVDTARAAGLKPTTLYDLERGEQRSSTRLHALCKTLGLNVEYVEHGHGPRLLKDALKDAQMIHFAGHGAAGGVQDSPRAAAAEEIEFGQEWGKLPEPARSMIRDLVAWMLASNPKP